MKKHNKVFKILFMVMVVALMTGCETIDNLDFGEMCVKCGDDVEFPAYLVKLCANIIGFIQVIVPVIIILVGMIELFKAVIASDEKKMSESKDSLIRKIIAGVMIYLVIAIIQFAFTAIPNFTDGDVDVMECVSYFITGPEIGDFCKERVTGNGVDLKDKDESASVNIIDPIEKEEKSGTHATCDSIGNNRTECKANGCSWDYTINECSANGSKAVKHCYDCTTGTRFRWSYGNPNEKQCSLLGDVKYESECKETKAYSDERRCYQCDNAGYYYYTYQIGNPDSKKCVEITASSSSECQSGSAGRVGTKHCYKCDNSGTVTYQFVASNPNSKRCEEIPNINEASDCNNGVE